VGEGVVAVKAALLDSFLAVYTPYGLVWYGPTDLNDHSYRLAMMLAGFLNALVVLPEELDSRHRLHAARLALQAVEERLPAVPQKHRLAWELVHSEVMAEVKHGAANAA
jgi:hypothetical protein